MLLENDSVGYVFLNVDTGEASAYAQLWFFWLGRDLPGKVDLALVVCRLNVDRNEYESVGVGVFTTYIVKNEEDSYFLDNNVERRGAAA